MAAQHSFLSMICSMVACNFFDVHKRVSRTIPGILFPLKDKYSIASCGLKPNNIDAEPMFKKKSILYMILIVKG